jgi:hypothetical protein
MFYEGCNPPGGIPGERGSLDCNYTTSIFTREYIYISHNRLLLLLLSKHDFLSQGTVTVDEQNFEQVDFRINLMLKVRLTDIYLIDVGLV